MIYARIIGTIWLKIRAFLFTWSQLQRALDLSLEAQWVLGAAGVQPKSVSNADSVSKNGIYLVDGKLLYHNTYVQGAHARQYIFETNGQIFTRHGGGGSWDSWVAINGVPT